MRSPLSAFSVLESSRPMMRSESRTEETSGLVTTMAMSAWRMARVAPRSMPAGLSQMTQSKAFFNDAITFSTPSGVRLSLSACLRGWQQVKRLHALVADQRLGQFRFALDNVDEVVDDAPFRAHDEIEIAQADVEIDDDDLVAVLRQSGAQRGRGTWSCRRRPCPMSPR